jgi:hypothetical protein
MIGSQLSRMSACKLNHSPSSCTAWQQGFTHTWSVLHYAPQAAVDPPAYQAGLIKALHREVLELARAVLPPHAGVAQGKSARLLAFAGVLCRELVCKLWQFMGNIT